jgi:hypothetical protein
MNYLQISPHRKRSMEVAEIPQVQLYESTPFFLASTIGVQPKNSLIFYVIRRDAEVMSRSQSLTDAEEIPIIAIDLFAAISQPVFPIWRSFAG